MRRSARAMGRSGAAAALVAASALLLAACGGSSSSESTAAASPAPASEAPASPAPASEAPASEAPAELTGQSLTVSNWAGYYPEDLGAQFEAATGVPLTIANHATNEEIMGKLTAGGDSGIDVAFVSGQYAQALNDAGLLAPIDAAQVPNLANLYAEANALPYDVGNTFSVPYAWGTTGICYRSDLVESEPTSWSAVLAPSGSDEGMVTALSTERWLALPALKQLGYSINTTDDAQLEEAKQLLIAQKPGLLAYDDTTFYTRLVSGEATMAVAWDGWCNYAIAEDPNVKFVVPDEGSDLWVDTMVVLNSSQNKEAAYAFINFILDPANHAWVAENILYKVPNAPAMDAVSAALVPSFPNMGLTPTDLLQQEAIVDLGEDSTKYTTMATEVTSS